MPDLIRVACVQMTSRGDKSANLEQAEALVSRAAATGADIAVLPEKWNAIGTSEVLHAAAEPLEGGESVEAMAEWSRRHGITLVGGSITERREGRVEDRRLVAPAGVPDERGRRTRVHVGQPRGA